MVRLRQRAPTGPILAGSGPSSPSAEKSSQKSMGEFHQRSRGQPRREVTWALAGSRAARAKLPLSGSAAGRSGLVMKRPARSGVERYSFTRGSMSGAAGAPRPVGFSTDQAMETLAAAAPGLVTR